MTPEGPAPRRRSLRSRALAVLGGLLLGLVVAELAVRLFGLGPEQFVVVADTFRLSDDPELVYENVPGGPDGELRLNADGLRDRDYPERKPAGTLRIAAIGDSVTFGYRVPRDSTWPKRLERLLKLCRGPDGPEFEVLNFGVIGYNADQIAAVPRAKVLRYGPDLIVYGYVLNDPQAYSLEADALDLLASRSRGRGQGTLTAILCQSRLFALARAWLAAPSEEPDLHDREPGFAAFRGGRIHDYLRGLHEDPASLARVGRCLDRLADSGPPALVAVFPARWDPRESAYPLAAAHERVVAEARSRGLAAADLAPAFGRVARETGAVLFQDHLHPDEAGHLAAALSILRALEESGVVPDGSLRLEEARARPGAEGRLARLVLRGP